MGTVRAEVFPAGEILAEELEARGWTQAEFAEIVGRPPQFVSEIISGKKEMTRESASQIAAALGNSPEFWLNVQDCYYLWRQAQDERTQSQLGEVRLRARLQELAPIALMRQRGLITGVTLQEQEREVKALYRINDINQEPPIAVAARRSTDDEKLSSVQMAWAACVRRRAEELTSGQFDPQTFERLVTHLTRTVLTKKDFAALPQRFAEVGVRLVFIAAFTGSKMDGCALLLDDGSPVIGISGRGKRFDKVLFTLLHEAAHIHLGHLDEEASLLLDEHGDGHTLGRERETDELASQWALPKEISKLPERINAAWINWVAEQQGVHPIVVIGRLQNDGHIPWKTTLVRDAPNVTSELANW